MIMRVIWTILICCIVFSSCKELEDPISTKTEPVFSLKGKLNADSLKLIAGENGYYHYTRHQLDPLNVFEFSSEFKRNDCENCDDKLKVTIRAHEKSVNNSINIFDALASENYDYIENVVLPRHRFIKFEVDTSFNPIGSSSILKWDFGDGNTSIEKAPVHYFNTDGKYKVKLDYSINSCVGTVTKDVAIQSDTVNYNCKFDFKYSVVNLTDVLFFGVDSTTPSSYLWDFGDGNTSVEKTPSHNYAEVRAYVVTLTVNRLAFGCITTVSKVLDLTQLNCPVTFTYGFTNNPSFDTVNYSKVLIEYTTPSGNYYRSDKMTQILPEFKLSELEPYENNELNNKTVKFKVNFTCDLINETGQTIKLKSMQGEIGVSYP